ncbi:MAG: galactokinase [Bacteroidota bacterium]
MEQHFTNLFQKKPTILSTSPGRINLIGEHTDYNDGFVLPGAIDKKVTFLLAANQSMTCRVYAVNADEVMEFSLADMSSRKDWRWQNYVIGVVAELQAAGAALQGFDATFEGDVPLGAGLSSSAALECALAAGLDALFGLGLSGTEIARISQLAEHNFAGVACGIMDQFASVMGKEQQVFRLDCRSLEYHYFPMDLGDYQLVLLNSCVSHALADSAYNDRRNECEMGVELLKQFDPKIRKLRDVSMEMLEAHRDALPEIVYRRCKHVVQENERVLAACDALAAQDVVALGELLYQSHDSLSGLYEVSCEELDFLVDVTRAKDFVLGARMMGGGFGGCTLNLIKSQEVAMFLPEITQAYQQEMGITLQVYPVSLGEGSTAIPIQN